MTLSAGMALLGAGAGLTALIAWLLHRRAVERLRREFEAAWQDRFREVRAELGGSRDRERTLAAALKSFEQEQDNRVAELETDLLRLTLIGRAAESLRQDREQERDALRLRLADLERHHEEVGARHAEAAQAWAAEARRYREHQNWLEEEARQAQELLAGANRELECLRQRPVATGGDAPAERPGEQESQPGVC